VWASVLWVIEKSPKKNPLLATVRRRKPSSNNYLLSQKEFGLHLISIGFEKSQKLLHRKQPGYEMNVSILTIILPPFIDGLGVSHGP
jgi:hypothetical protein